ncbi:MAG: immunoglobulin domain-containing protein [Ferruginibacter sp.]
MRKLLFVVVFFIMAKSSVGQCTAVSISTQPQNKTANVGSTVTFSIGVNGTSPFLYFWYKNNVQISGANSSTYTTPTLSLSDNGNIYKCIVTNCSSTFQATSNSATLTVSSTCTPVSISSQPQNQTANVGGAVTFSVGVNGTSPFSYFWYKNFVQIPGANSSSYTTPILTIADSGNRYKCVIKNCNNASTVTSNNVLLSVNSSSCTAVSISSQPQNQTAGVGSTATFSVGVSGTSPFLYFWYKNNVQISGASSSTYTTPSLTQGDNGNTYKCIVTNCSSTFQAITNNATLTVNSSCTPVSISSQPQNLTKNVGNTATFNVSVSGTGPFTYYWYKNFVQIPGANNSSYTTPMLKFEDNGNKYKCIVKNCNNASVVTSNNAVLTVRAKIDFSDMSWNITDSRLDTVRPGPNYFDPNNVWLDNNGFLHLAIKKNTSTGKWYCSEVFTDSTFASGVYQFWVEGRIDLLDKNVVFGMFDYKGPVTDQFEENDIEYAKWGNSSADILNYTVYPAFGTPGGRETYHMPCTLNNSNSTQRFTRKYDNILFQSLNGFQNDNTSQYENHLFTNNPIILNKSNMPVAINLWLNDGNFPSDGNNVELIIHQFTYVPDNCPESFEPNDDTTRAPQLFATPLYQMNTSTIVNSIISAGSDQDWYKIPLDGKGTLGIDLTNLPANYDIELYPYNGLSGGALAGSYNTGTNNETITYTYNTPASTILYIKVYPNSSSQYSQCDKYKLTVSWVPILNLSASDLFTHVDANVPKDHL